ncbi:uncharacterized protein HGUI_02790 [Hanseniaspora guilliermondii]|uniref:HMG box domain-containing protein n=1 Tax=Hanseniaspora guilliermondii TaxID=56406 RepID=A0A1L0FLZ5_9ASCO|nr:uncharacterized protein HGUI_02790 [Hanseniaspora guilliermondii]
MAGKLPSISSMLNNEDKNKSVSHTPLPGMHNNSYTNLTTLSKPLLNVNNQLHNDSYSPINNLPNYNKQSLTIPVVNNQYTVSSSPYMISMKFNNQMQVTPLSASTIVYKQYPSANVSNFSMNTKNSYSDPSMGYSNINTPINSTQFLSHQPYNNYIRNCSPMDIPTRQNFQPLPMMYQSNVIQSSNPSPIMVHPLNCNINNEIDNNTQNMNYTPTSQQMFVNKRYHDNNQQPKELNKKSSKRKNSKRALKDNNAIVEVDCLNVETPTKKVPRPRNAFILFRQHYHKIIFKEQSELLLKAKEKSADNDTTVDSFKLNSTVSKAIGLKWKNLSPEERSHWTDLAEKEKIEHSLKYPDYKYVPKRKKTISTTTSLQKTNE